MENEVLHSQTAVLVLTPAAEHKLRELMQARNIPDYGLRIFVTGGGCSGLQYGMVFEPQAREFDTVIEQNGVRLFVDPTSLIYLRGASVDFVDSLMGGGFKIDNPNAVSSCGCGHSFRTKDSSTTDKTDEGNACGCGCG
ncbi:MAG: iron-sulfur cluster insertion protein ErpA [Thermoflexales bacterium]